MNQIKCVQCGEVSNDVLDLYVHKKTLCLMKDICNHCGVNIGLFNLEEHIMSKITGLTSEKIGGGNCSSFFKDNETKLKLLIKVTQPSKLKDICEFVKDNYEFNDKNSCISSKDLIKQMKSEFPNITYQKIKKVMIDHMGLKYTNNLDHNLFGFRCGYIGIKKK
jgi:hypothetical protein